VLQVIILGIVSFLVDVSSEMVYPLLPIFLTQILKANVAILGIVEGIAESIASLLKLGSGYLSDRIRKRKLLALIGYGLSWAGKFFFVFATGWHWVFSGRLFDRIGKGIRTSPRDALISDHTPREKRGQAYGLHRSLDTFGAFVGVLIASYFVKTALDGTSAAIFRKIFIFSIMFGFTGWLVLFLVKEKKEIPDNVSKKPFVLLQLRLPRKLKLFLGFAFLFSLGNSSNQFLLLRIQEQTGSLSLVLLAYLMYNLSYGLLAWPCGRLSDIIGHKQILVAGYFIYGLVYWAFAFGAGSSSSYIWILALYGFYMALTEGVEKSLVSNLAPEDAKASALGLHAALVGIGLLPASLLAGFLWKFTGPSTTFAFGGTIGILASVGLLFIL